MEPPLSSRTACLKWQDDSLWHSTPANGWNGCRAPFRSFKRKRQPRKRDNMKAIAVFPGKPDSVHLAALPKPALEEVAGGRGVLVRVHRVGVDGTDREINAAEYGRAPDGYDFLVIGHENFGRVEAVGRNVTELK